MQSRTAIGIVIPILLAGMLAVVDAGAQQQPEPQPDQSGAASQQPGPPDATSCFGSGAIVGGYRQPPTPDEVKAREDSPACRGVTGGGPDIDSSAKAGDELDKIYGKLMRIDRSQGGGSQ